MGVTGLEGPPRTAFSALPRFGETYLEELTAEVGDPSPASLPELR
jgi:hypothetical protein